jgi:hypothetical protein
VCFGSFPARKAQLRSNLRGEADGDLGGKKEERLAGEAVRIGPTEMAAHDHGHHQHRIEQGSLSQNEAAE